MRELREVSAYNENLFTAIYASAFRRDHALRAYGQDTSGPPFSSLLTCVPSSVYALAALADRPAWWVGQPAIVVNMNVSWLRWALIWHLERMPDLFDMAELAGVDPVRVDRHRVKHARNAGEWTREALLKAEPAIRGGVSVARLIERCKHLPALRGELPKLRAAYEAAWNAGRVVVDAAAPEELFRRYGSPTLDNPSRHRPARADYTRLAGWLFVESGPSEELLLAKKFDGFGILGHRVVPICICGTPRQVLIVLVPLQGGPASTKGYTQPHSPIPRTGGSPKCSARSDSGARHRPPWQKWRPLFRPRRRGGDTRRRRM